MIYTVTLNPALDYFCTVDQLRPGETNRCKTEDLIAGGKGINVSLMLAHLNVSTTALGFTAGFTGRELVHQLQQSGMMTDFVDCRNGRTRINVKVSAEEETEINGRGPQVTAQEMEALLDKIRKIRSGDTLVLSGNVPPNVSPDIFERILAQIHDPAVRIVVDAEGNLLLKALRFRPFLIKPNLTELKNLVSCPQASLKEQAEELQRAGARNVLISMGKEGAVLFAENGAVLRQFPVHGQTVSSVGAGDSMVAGFLAASGTSDFNPYEALRLAAACGSATAFSRGIADRETVENCLTSVRVDDQTEKNV